jgi:hypothetical protein
MTRTATTATMIWTADHIMLALAGGGVAGVGVVPGVVGGEGVGVATEKVGAPKVPVPPYWANLAALKQINQLALPSALASLASH